MAPESLQAMMSMATQLEQMGLTPGMQSGTGTLPFTLMIADEWRRFTMHLSRMKFYGILPWKPRSAWKAYTYVCTWLPAFADLKVGICLIQ